MAEPGDPKPPEPTDPDVDHDAGVGFASAASLHGRAWTPPTRASDLTPGISQHQNQISPTPPRPSDRRSRRGLPGRRETPAPSGAGHSGFGSRREAPVEINGGLGLFSVYALILFAVPTLGVSALIALLAVTRQPGPTGELAASHFLFQQRTLWVGAIAALVGAVLIAVGLGVFVLFFLAVWLILRGAGGVLKLKAGHPIANPRAWLF